MLEIETNRLEKISAFILQHKITLEFHTLHLQICHIFQCLYFHSFTLCIYRICLMLQHLRLNEIKLSSIVQLFKSLSVYHTHTETETL